MRNFIGGIAIAVILFGVFRYCENQKDQKVNLTVASNLIEKEIKNVSKLIVSEGHYAKVYTYKDAKTYYFDFLTAEKKAVLIANAAVQISYDLSALEITTNAESQTVSITNIPDPEVKLFPKIEYYDLQQGFLNTFEAADYNKMNEQVEANLKAEIAASALMKNAQNRLIAELQKLFILTNAQGWTLVYEEKPISTNTQLLELLN